MFNAKWYNDDGTTSAVATDPAWQDMANWQKELVDFYGYDNLQRFVAGQGDEWGAEQDFETGRIAMTIDGEWRTSENFMGDPPAVNYMTAPFPVPDDQADMYGMGQVGGTIIGIPKGSPHPEEAWLLVKCMATDTPTRSCTWRTPCATCRRPSPRSSRPTWTSRRSSRRSWTSSRTRTVALQGDLGDRARPTRT